MTTTNESICQRVEESYLQGYIYTLHKLGWTPDRIAHSRGLTPREVRHHIIQAHKKIKDGTYGNA